MKKEKEKGNNKANSDSCLGDGKVTFLFALCPFISFCSLPFSFSTFVAFCLHNHSAENIPQFLRLLTESLSFLRHTI